MKGYTLLKRIDVGDRVRLVGGTVGRVMDKRWDSGVPVLRIETDKTVLALQADWAVRLELVDRKED